jgi:regulator of sigma E protease
MEELGFQDGDQILKIDGEVPFNVLDVNKEILIFGVSSIEVEHPTGEIETIAIPAETDMALFQAGESAFTPRSIDPVVDSLVPGKAAEKAGFEKGDLIVGVDDVTVKYWNDFTGYVQQTQNQEVLVAVVRDGQTLQIPVTTDDEGRIGLSIDLRPENLAKIDHKDYGFFESLGKGFGHGYNTLYGYVAQFKFVFTAKGSTGIGGFGAIGGMFPNTWDWELFWERTAMISIILAFMNILPIPALDGGHVLFLLYEMISGKAPSDKFLTRAQVVGMIILLGLLLYANGLDIYRAIAGE